MYLSMCVFQFVIVFVILERQWIVGVMSFQKIYDLMVWHDDVMIYSETIGWKKNFAGDNGSPRGPRGPLFMCFFACLFNIKKGLILVM